MKSSKSKNWIFTLVISIIGLLDSIYLLIIKISRNPLLCIQGVGDCWSVNTSKYSEVYGIPVSIFGTLGYLVISLLILIIRYNTALEKTASYLFFGFSSIGFLYSIYLTYVEIFVLKALCPFCILSAVIMSVLFLFSIVNITDNSDL